MSERIISIAREHHLYPKHIVGYGFRDYVAYSSWPSLVILGPPMLAATALLEPTPLSFAAVYIGLIVLVVIFFGTYAHRLGHIRSRSPIVRALQRAHLLMNPGHHVAHHRGGHDTHYCVINGWANHVCDRTGFWRGLERLVSWTTGAVPRANDRVWSARMRQDPAFLSRRQA
jgi:ubiquitin-conjugating enzyme E2 variant